MRRVLVLGFSAALLAGSLAAPPAGAVPPDDPPPLTSLSTPGLPAARLPFRSYGAGQGLTNLAARRLVQDGAGFLWLATEDGLIRYDGGRFQRYGLEEGLPSAWISALAAAPPEGLWVGTAQGVARMVEDRFVPLGAAEGLPLAACNGLAIDGEGRVWAALATGLFVGSASSGFGAAPGWPGGGATAVHAIPSGGVCASRGGSVGLWSGGQWRFDDLAPGWINIIDELVVDRDGTVWVQSARHLFARPAGARSFRDVTREIPPVNSRGFIGLDRSRRLWVPTDEGISCRADGSWVNIGKRLGLPFGWSSCMVEDREGSLWVGSIGVHRLVGRGLWASWTRAEGLPSDVVWCILRGRDQRLWVATEEGLAQATPAGWKVLPGTGRTVVRRIAQAADGALWLGCMPGEFWRVEPGGGKITRFGPASTAGGGTLRGGLLCLLGDRSGHVWASARGTGLLRFDPARGRFEREAVPDGAPDESFLFVYEDGRGRVWAAGERGLLCRDGGRWRRFGRRDGLARDRVACIAEDPSGDLWIAYFESIGLARIRLEGERLQILQSMDTRSGLASDKEYFLGEDRLGRLWVGSGNGVDLVSPQGILHFSEGGGLAGNDCNASAFLAEPDGRVFIGTSAGLSMFQGATQPLSPEPPWMRVLSVRLGGEARFPGCPQPVSVPYDRSTFEVAFSGLSFVDEDLVQHEVRMEGLEPEWRPSRIREARYAQLPPGSYRFEARARLAGGAWSAPAGFSFEVGKPWWQTWPARAAALALLAGAVALIVGMRLRQLHRRTRELEAAVAARTSELAEANRVLAEVSVTDPLTGARNRRYLTLSLPEEVARVVRAYRRHRETKLAGWPDGNDLAFLIVDIDHFKEVNDRFGHDTGDRVLTEACVRISRAARGSDTVVRWGGEEFLVVARGCSREDATTLAEKVHAAVGGEPFDLGDGRWIRRSCCLGFASFPLLRGDPGAFSWEEVVSVADRCLYAAKASGRDAWVGLATTDGAAGEPWKSWLPHDVPAAISAGAAKVLTSLPSPASVRWN